MQQILALIMVEGFIAILMQLMGIYNSQAINSTTILKNPSTCWFEVKLKKNCNEI